MKKKFRFLLEIEQEFKTKKLNGRKEVTQYFNLLIKETINHEAVLIEYMELLILGCFFNAIELDDVLAKDEFEILEPVLKSLPPDAQEFFRKIFTTPVKEQDYFRNHFFSCFSPILLKQLIFNVPELDQDFPHISINKAIFS